MRDAAAALVDAVESEKRRDVEVTAGDFGPRALPGVGYGAGGRA